MAKTSSDAGLGTYFLLGLGAFFLIKNKSASASITPSQQALSIALPRSPTSGAGTSYNIWIQETLNRLLGAGLETDGIIGPKTRQWILKFQETWGLTQDGVVGPETDYNLRAAMGTTGYIEQPYAYTPQNTWS